MEAGETWNVSLEWPPPSLDLSTITQTPSTIVGSGIPLNYAGLSLIVIPLITLLGNLLVIISVLRYRALQSAINFLILGLAVADLLVAIIVMPYAVYVYVTNGDWYLGNLMCDIYMASDVCCSTASILLLAVISFDRYRAVSLPIQYSRQSQNVKRVWTLIAVIWLVSLTLASPMVFGVNVRPPDANPYECRFYNAEFSILSSMISFVIPCFLVLFVYIRIIIALKKREKAAKMRREKNTIAHGLTMRPDTGEEQVDEEAAGRIVAGPDEREFGNSSTPRSSLESLSENVNVITNDFVSENCTTFSRRSSYADDSQPTSSQTSSGDGRSYSIKGQKRFRNLSRNYSTKHHRKVVKVNRGNSRNNSRTASITNQSDDALIPAIIRTISRKSPRLFRRDKTDIKKHSMILANPITEPPKEYRRVSMPIHPTNSQTETETISASRDIENLPTTTISRSTTANSAELLGSPDDFEKFPALITETVLEDVLAETREGCFMQPTVSFALTVREMEGNALNNLKGCSVESSRRVSQVDPPLAIQILTRPSLPHLDLQRMDSIGTTCSSKTRADSLRSVDSKGSKKSNRNGIAVKLVKRAIKHEHSLKRKVSKAQRKEKRATKTLGVVVGVFLVCWVPFFVINILNAVCILLNKDSCQVGYDLFFYCTWIGYMNSFMNPIIYTIFNTEFRRAFKSIIFGRNSTRHHFSNKQAHV
ncbi:Dopamine receptor 2 [Caenorhabditis elegans]|uniref:Isoform a of Dopamine receptor 2 n=1 Tax=Caenorhabditis elegans TaxID=6239 RepID=E7EM37-2|nr:Dopamine receptor 2 [Caenorhabditis elegans]BAD01496.1 D2-like dopamine receptor short variant [Caenorhabditis elegans]CAB03199.3 Dopamine receptor 2 [Caenorhabditis elegans]|eukprot:NP_001024047.1 DOPamine receptor [Caenorhabditis elegans]